MQVVEEKSAYSKIDSPGCRVMVRDTIKGRKKIIFGEGERGRENG